MPSGAQQPSSGTETSARPLPKSLRRIRLCADDYGIAPGVNAAIRDLILRGRLNATSVMMVGPSLDKPEARSLLILNAGHDRVAIGLHLTLTAPFKPLSGGYRPVSEGAFLPLATTVWRGLLRLLNRRALENEIAAQFRAFETVFRRAPDFVDGHQHVHLLPQVREAVLAEMKRSAPNAWIRQCGGRSRASTRRNRKGQFIAWLSRGLRRRARAAGVATNPTFSGAYDYGPSADFATLFPAFLDGHEEGGVVMCHPGYVDEHLRRLDPLTDLRAREHAYLSSDEFPRVLATRGFTLG